MKIHIAVIIVIISLLLVPSCINKITYQEPAQEIPRVEKVNYKIEKVTSTPNTKPIPKPVPKPIQKISEIALTSFGAETIELINVERVKSGLNRLTNNTKLNAAATIKAEELVRAGRFSHYVQQDGNWIGIGSILIDLNYKFKIAGENLSKDIDMPDDNVKAWMDSPLHKKNLLKLDFTEVGIAKVKNIVVLVLAQPYE